MADSTGISTSTKYGLEDELVQRFQDNLAKIRKVADMTAQELADEIGVTRQTISSLESKKTKMNRTQYLALRSVFNYRAASNQELALIIKTLVDDPVQGLAESMDGDTADSLKKSAILGVSATTAIMAGAITARAVGIAFPAVLSAAIPSLIALFKRN